MPTFNVDEAKGLYETITVIMDGKEYSVVPKITQDLFDQITKVDIEQPQFLERSLAVLFGCPHEEFVGKDIRKLTAIHRFVHEKLQAQMAGKTVDQNPTKPTPVGKSGK